MENSRLRFAFLPLVLLLTVSDKLLPSSWRSEYPLLLAAIIAAIGVWVGIATWRGVKAQNA